MNERAPQEELERLSEQIEEEGGTDITPEEAEESLEAVRERRETHPAE